MLSRLFGGDDEAEPDEYAVMRLTEPKAVLERYDSDPPGPEVWEVEHRDDVEPGVYALREVVTGQFREQLWKIEIEGDGDDDELEELKREVRRLREARSDGGATTRQRQPGPPEDMKKSVMWGMANGQVAPEMAEALAKFNAVWEGEDEDAQITELVDDPTDMKKVFGAAAMKMLDNYDSPREMMEDVTSGAVGGAMAVADGDDEGDDEQAADRADHADPDGDEADDWSPRDVGSGPSGPGDLGDALDFEADDQEAADDPADGDLDLSPPAGDGPAAEAAAADPADDGEEVEADEGEEADEADEADEDGDWEPVERGGAPPTTTRAEEIADDLPDDEDDDDVMTDGGRDVAVADLERLLRGRSDDDLRDLRERVESGDRLMGDLRRRFLELGLDGDERRRRFVGVIERILDERAERRRQERLEQRARHEAHQSSGADRETVAKAGLALLVVLVFVLGGGRGD